MTDTGWRFNKDYHDQEQITDLMPAYTARYEELRAAGKYPYNDSFRGYIGADGPDEDTAIYLCQCQRSLNEMYAQVEKALADGYVAVKYIDGTVKCDIAVYGFYMGGTGWHEYHDIRLTHRSGTGFAFLPKRAKTQWRTLIATKVLIRVKNPSDMQYVITV
jgi:hypothetical protein